MGGYAKNKPIPDAGPQGCLGFLLPALLGMMGEQDEIGREKARKGEKGGGDTNERGGGKEEAKEERRKDEGRHRRKQGEKA